MSFGKSLKKHRNPTCWKPEKTQVFPILYYLKVFLLYIDAIQAKELHDFSKIPKNLQKTTIPQQKYRAVKKYPTDVNIYYE